MRVLVVGSGAVGSFLAWAAASGGLPVTLVRRRRAGPAGEEPLTAIRPDGERVPSRVTVAASVADAVATGEPPDLVIVAVKQYDLASALADLVPLPTTPVLTVQNGIGAEEATRAARPDAPLLAGSLTAAVELEPDGAVRWRRTGGLAVAAVTAGAAPAGRDLLAAVRRAGLPAVALPEAAAMKWSKLLANLVANATSAILASDPVAIYRDPATFRVEREQLAEARRVMTGLGLAPVDLPGARVRLLLLGLRLPPVLARPILARVVGGARGGKAPSLGRTFQGEGDGPIRSEAAWLNGAVAEAGRRVAVATPVNAGLAAILAEIEADPSRGDWFRGRPDRLLGVLGRG